MSKVVTICVLLSFYVHVNTCIYKNRRGVKEEDYQETERDWGQKDIMAKLHRILYKN